MIEISDLDYFSAIIRLNYTERHERGLKSPTEIGGGECVVTLDTVSLLEVKFHKRLLKSQAPALVNLVEANL